MAVSLKIIKPAGVLDSVQANELRQQVSELVAAGNNHILLDMADVNFIDSSGLESLIVTLKILRTAGGELYLYSIAEPVRKLLKVTGMDRLFAKPIAPTLLGDAKLPDVRD
jgi:anti-anti-sigma factor